MSVHWSVCQCHQNVQFRKLEALLTEKYYTYFRSFIHSFINSIHKRRSFTQDASLAYLTLFPSFSIIRVGPDAADDLRALRASIWRSITEKGFQPVLILSTNNHDSFGLKFFNDGFDHIDCVKYGNKYFMLFFNNCSYGNCHRSVGVFDSD